MVMTDVVDIQNISRTFKTDGKDFHALKDVSFSVKEGEIFGLLGPNGAGKTTLINILTTLLLPTKGTAYIDGFDVTTDRYKILELINSVSGETRFHYLITVKEILQFYSELYGLTKQQKKERMPYVIENFEMENLLNKRFQWLSSGERMRVILAKSLLNHPKVLFLDEPTLGLDPNIAIKTRKLVHSLRKEWDVTILLTSHYMKEVERLCKRIAFINRGKIIFAGDIKTLRKKYPSLESYFVKVVGERNEPKKNFGCD